MAIFQTTWFSNTLHRLTEMTVILPVEVNKSMPPQLQERDAGPLKTVMLLHGFSGTHSDWLYGSRIQQLAMKYHIAVLCPSGENGFYVDDEKRDALYEQYLCEVLEFGRRVFPLSEKREDTAIGGLSMGGYGAMRNGLKHPELFGKIIALSSALITDRLAQNTEQQESPMASAAYYDHVFGAPETIPGSDRDPKYLAKRLKESGGALPRIFMACGTEDFLLAPNNDFSAYLDSIGIGHDYRTGPGIHDWAFWDVYIEQALDWAYGESASERPAT